MQISAHIVYSLLYPSLPFSLPSHAETQLSNPALFADDHPPCWKVSEEYLALARQYPCAMSAIRGHLFKIWLKV